jgi:hypothetical protein
MHQAGVWVAHNLTHACCTKARSRAAHPGAGEFLRDGRGHAVRQGCMCTSQVQAALGCRPAATGRAPPRGRRGFHHREAELVRGGGVLMRTRWLALLGIVVAAPAWAKDAADAGAHGAATAAAPLKRLEPTAFKAALEKARASGKFTLLDVREQNETAGGYVQGAELLPYNSGVSRASTGRFRRTGRCSSSAQQDAARAGRPRCWSPRAGRTSSRSPPVATTISGPQPCSADRCLPPDQLLRRPRAGALCSSR